MFPSPFVTKLGTNYCPPDEELAEIQTLLVEPGLRLKRLDDEIAGMRKAIDELLEERECLGSYMEAHRALTSPIRRLPLDIIEEIFLACIPTHRNCVMSAEEAPVILGRICSSWRAISFSTPRLWSRLHIVEPTRPYELDSSLFDAKVAQRLETTTAWLRRAGECLLSISLEGRFDDGFHPESPDLLTTAAFLHALVPFASRWQNIHLAAPPSAFGALAILSDKDVPWLKSLKIVQRPEHPDASYRWGPSSIFNGSNLSRFSISGDNFNPLELPLRWNQLTDLSIIGPTRGLGDTQTVTVVLRVLSGCPELRTFKGLLRDNFEDIVDSTIKCPFLHTINLTSAGAPLYTSGRLFCHLSLPGLRHFKFRGQGPEPHGASSESLALILASSLAPSTSLECIDLDSHAFSKASLNNLLGGLPPAIRSLHITDISHSWRPLGEDPFDNDILEAFIPSPDRPSPHCPALQELILIHCRMLSDETLLRFIESRMSGSCSVLQRIDVRFNREIQVDILPSLEPFIAAGLRANVRYIPPAIPQFSPWVGLVDAPHGPWISPHVYTVF
ncbi:hypothetical protein B0H17DRAFT_1078131 [Mycena rosella]|uniref:F-box domain-containing protein n=1 Tax=Mycena rosella TaxID=1033263 RepID=A0AAD7GDB2_MYCRO|nr:hypothetical protein B0H17DRAFT_1078131 [Mycena rosella]